MDAPEILYVIYLNAPSSFFLPIQVRPPDSSGKAPVFPGLNNMPNPEQRAELLRIAEFYTSTPPPRHHLPVAPPTNSTPIPPSSRESSQERGKVILLVKGLIMS